MILSCLKINTCIYIRIFIYTFHKILKGVISFLTLNTIFPPKSYDTRSRSIPSDTPSGCLLVFFAAPKKLEPQASTNA